MAITFKCTDGIALVELNRPDVLNAINPQMRAEMRQIWETIKEDPAIRVVILTGKGERAFCVGSDLKMTPAAEHNLARESFSGRHSEHLLNGLLDLEIPVICAINGYAIGGGLEIALACDIRIASKHAEFALTEVKIGSIPGAAGTQTLPRTVGLSNALYMMLTGSRINAQQALQFGLISEQVTAEQLLPRAHEIAVQIAKNAPLSVRAIKKLAREGMEMSFSTAMHYERLAFGAIRETADRAEGRAAFREKRTPKYQGK